MDYVCTTALEITVDQEKGVCDDFFRRVNKMPKFLVTANDEFSGQQVVIAEYEEVEDEQKAKEKAVSYFSNLNIGDLIIYELK